MSAKQADEMPGFYNELSLEEQRLVLLYWTYEHPEKENVTDDELESIVDEALNEHTPEEIEAIAAEGREEVGR